MPKNYDEEECVRCGDSIHAHVIVTEAESGQHIYICPKSTFSNDYRDVGGIYRTGKPPDKV